MYRQFHRIFEIFKISETKPETDDLASQAAKSAPVLRKAEKIRDQFEVDEETEEVSILIVSKRMFKSMLHLIIHSRKKQMTKKNDCRRES